MGTGLALCRGDWVRLSVLWRFESSTFMRTTSLRSSTMIFSLPLLVCLSMVGTEGQHDESIRVMTWNVLVGFQTYQQEGDPWPEGKVRLAEATDFLKEARPDIVAWQEMNGWTPERLVDWTRPLGLTHGVFVKEGGYPVALSSRWPIEVVERHLNGMHHGLLHCRTHGIDFLVVHFSPGSHPHRLREIEQVMQRVERLKAEKKPCMVLGDFNASSPQDDALFGESAMNWWRRWKYPVTDAGRPQTDILQRALDSDLKDAWLLHRPDTIKLFQNRPRIDFILLSKDLAGRCTSAEWLDTSVHHRMSDHPPTIADIQL